MQLQLNQGTLIEIRTPPFVSKTHSIFPSNWIFLPQDIKIAISKELTLLKDMMALAKTCKTFYSCLTEMLNCNPKVLSQAITQSFQHNKLTDFFCRFREVFTASVPIELAFNKENQKSSCVNIEKLFTYFPNATMLKLKNTSAIAQDQLVSLLQKNQKIKKLSLEYSDCYPDGFSAIAQLQHLEELHLKSRRGDWEDFDKMAFEKILTQGLPSLKKFHLVGKESDMRICQVLLKQRTGACVDFTFSKQTK